MKIVLTYIFWPEHWVFIEAAVPHVNNDIIKHNAVLINRNVSQKYENEIQVGIIISEIMFFKAQVVNTTLTTLL